MLPLLREICLELLEPEVDATRVIRRCPLWLLEHDWEEPLADCCGYLSLLASVKTALQDEKIRYRQENLSVAALDLLPKLFMLLACAFNKLTEADELFAFVSWYKMCSSEAPSLLKSGHQVDQLWIVPELGVDNFDVLGVSLYEEVL